MENSLGLRSFIIVSDNSIVTHFDGRDNFCDYFTIEQFLDTYMYFVSTEKYTSWKRNHKAGNGESGNGESLKRGVSKRRNL